MSAFPEPEPVVAAGRNDIAFRFAPRYRVVWVALAGLIILTLVSANEVFQTNSMNLVTGLTGVLAIASAGQLLVIMSGGIDLSVPAVMTFAAAIVVHRTNGSNGSLLGAIVLAVALCGAIGVINGILVAYVRLNALIVTLAMNGVVTGVMLLWIGTTFSTTGQVPSDLAQLGRDHVGFLSVIAIVAIVAIGFLALLLRQTVVGRSFVAAGTNRVAAEIIGVRVSRYEVAGYALAGVLYSAGGILLAGMLTTPDQSLGSAYQLSTIIAVALGGATLAGGPASLTCTIGGCLFVSLLDQYLQAKSFSGGVNQIVNGAVLIVAVALVTAGSGRRLRARRLPRLPRLRHDG